MANVISQQAACRILDANFNRTREALRVVEEYARFVLNDALLTEACKCLRHELADCMRGVDCTGKAVPAEAGGSLVLSRDIVGDVGREVTAAGEYDRNNTLDVARAACKRLSESLRVIEEYGKVVGGTLPKSEATRREEGASCFAPAIERLRYRGYELERRLIRTVTAQKRFEAVRLYVIVTGALCRGDWFETAKAAIAGGADCLQLREKDLSDRELLGRATRLARLCRENGRLFIVNDRPDIAAASGADGVHLGQDDLSIAAARRVLPARGIVGVSTHSLDQVRAAAEQAPDYIAVGPMFATETKLQTHIPGPPLLAEAAGETSIPLVAIGGIDEERVRPALISASAIICVCGAVIRAIDVTAAVRRLRDSIEQVRPAESNADPCTGR